MVVVVIYYYQKMKNLEVPADEMKLAPASFRRIRAQAKIR